MFKKITATCVVIILTFFVLVPATEASSHRGVDSLKGKLGTFGGQTGLGSSGDAELTPKIAAIINIVLGFVGVVAVIFIIYAGFRWITAGGNDEKVTEARGHIKNALIGLVVVFLAFIIVNFTVDRITRATGAGSGGSSADVSSPDDQTGVGNGACVYTPLDAGGLCKTSNECAQGISSIACSDLRGVNLIRAGVPIRCPESTWFAGRTCKDLGYTLTP
jgi:hypothetical protein